MSGRRGSRGPTVSDVAREANVSIATVSHVLNGTRHVSPATLQRVNEAIAATGYTPNFVARSLRRASTDSIGLVISDFANPYFADVVRGIEEEAEKSGMSLLLANSDDDAQRELRRVEALIQRRVDGLILSPTIGSDDAALPFLKKQGLPTVLIDRLTPSGFDQVGVTNEEPTRKLVEHLIGLGHRRIGMVAGVEGISTTEERLRGYRAALGAAGIPFDADVVRTGRSRSGPAHDAVIELMALPDRPTALVAANNLMAIGTLKALQELGLSIPEDVAVVAFDDFEWSELLAAKLTTVRQPGDAIGRAAVKLLQRRVARPDIRRVTKRLDPTIVHRASCGCDPAAPDHDLLSFS